MIRWSCSILIITKNYQCPKLSRRVFYQDSTEEVVLA